MNKKYFTTLLVLFLCAFQIHLLQAQNDCFTVQLSSETGQVGDTIAVDVTVKGFEEIIGIQYTLEWDTTQLRYIRVNDFNLPDLASTDFGPTDPEAQGLSNLSWLDFSLEGVTLTDGSTIYRLYFEVIAAKTSDIQFLEQPTHSEFVTYTEDVLSNYGMLGAQIITSDSPVMETPMTIGEACVDEGACLNFGTVIIPEISGGVPPYNYIWSGPNDFSSYSKNLTGITENGNYELVVIDDSGNRIFSTFHVYLTNNSVSEPVNFFPTSGLCQENKGKIRPLLPPDSIPNYDYHWNTGATTGEVSNLSIGSYSVTVTDDDGCEQVESFELRYQRLQAHIWSDCDSFPQAELSSFVMTEGVSPYTFAWSTGDTTYVDSTFETTSIMATGQEYYNLTITDASGVCQKIYEEFYAHCPGTYDMDIYFSPDEDSLEIGEAFCVEIKVNGFIDLIGFQGSIIWDSLALKFDTLIILDNLPFFVPTDFGTLPELVGNGKLPFLWVGPNWDGESLPDSTGLFQLCFKILPGADSINTIRFSHNPTSMSFANDDDEFLDVNDGTATIYVGNWDGVSTIELIGGQVPAIVNESVCIPISVNEFYDITDLQFSLNWDPTELSFTNVQALNLPNLTLGDFDLTNAALGQLGLSWSDTGPDGIDLVNGTEIFEVCFQSIGGSYSTNVNFSDTPIPIAANTADDAQVIVNTTNGIISISGIVTWPGDTDVNERVDNGDLLNMGLAFGEIGPARLNTSIDWQEYPVAEWNYQTPNSTINGAHMDADGNGVVDQNDVLAIEQNYGEETNFWNDADEHRSPILPTALTLTEATFMVETQTVNPGQEATFNILFGDETTPAENIYGLAFTIVYDPTAIVGGSLSASFADSWLGDENNDLITVYRERAEDNRIDIALSRINQENQSGFGAIAQLNLTIAELIQEENYAMAFDIENVRIINASEEVIPSVQPTTYSEILGTTDTNAPELANQVSLFPVPARDFLQIRTGTLTIENTALYTIDGKLIQQWSGNPQEISTGEFEAGTYVLKLSTARGIVHKRFVKTR